MQIISKSKNQVVLGDNFKSREDKRSFECFQTQVYEYLVKKNKNAKKIRFEGKNKRYLTYQVVKELIIYRRMLMEGLKNAGPDGEPCEIAMSRYLSENISRDRQYFDENYGQQKKKEVFEVGYL